MGEPPEKWSGIVEWVERFARSTANTLKQHSRDLNRLYLLESGKKLDEHRAERMEQASQKQSERNMVDSMVMKEGEKQAEERKRYQAKER